MQKYHKKHDDVHYINNNYVLNPFYNDENECINDTLSMILILICTFLRASYKSRTKSMVLNISSCATCIG